MFLSILLSAYIIFVNYFNGTVYCFNFKHDPVLIVNSINENTNFKKFEFFTFPKLTDPKERFTLLQTEDNFLVIGARNRLINLLSNNTQVQIIETNFFDDLNLGFLNSNIKNQEPSNYILTILPFTENEREYNRLICGAYYNIFQCIKANQNQTNGLIEFYSKKVTLGAPKSVTFPINSRNAFYLSKNDAFYEYNQTISEYVLYAASSWSENSQYLAAHTSRYNYQDNNIFKKIGASKSFVRFLENSDKLFLFHNEISFEIDEGEKDRDILFSTSLVTQFCKNDRDILNNFNPAFYTELTAKIYCFNNAFKSNSGNSKNFKFDSLDQNDFEDHQFMPQTCPNLTQSEKYNYDKFTSKLGYMSKAMLPIKKRKASFITTNEYRLYSLLVIDQVKDQMKFFPSVKKTSRYDYFNIILAGTDNGKLMRMVHFFNVNYFYNEDLDEESFHILEDVQLFDKNKTINEIRILKSNNKFNIIAISNDQIKSIPSDFCSFYSTCEQCLQAYIKNDLFNEICSWSDKCVAINKNNTLSQYKKIEDCKPRISSQGPINDLIFQIRNTSNTESVTYAPKNEHKSETNQKLKSNSNNNILLTYGIMSSVIIISVTCTIAGVYLKKRRSKLLNGDLNEKKIKINDSSQYIDNIYSNFEHKRNQNLYQKNIFMNSGSSPTKDSNSFNTISSESSQVSAKKSVKPYQYMEEPANFILDYSSASSSLPNSVLEFNRNVDKQHYQNYYQFPFCENNNQANLSLPTDFSYLYQGNYNHSFVIACDDGDRIYENNFILASRDRFKENENQNSSIGFNCSTLF